MKRLIALAAVLYSLTTINLILAQDIKYEVIRTPEAPGYFALRVYPGAQMPPLAMQTVFVENYTAKAERRRHAGLTQHLRQNGALVLSAQQAVDYVDDPRFQIVLLGGPPQNRWPQFKAPVGSDAIAAFTQFSQRALSPVYLANLTAEFGGNITQVKPSQLPFLKDRTSYFVGQFERPIKTRVSLKGETSDAFVQAEGVLDLTTFTPHQATATLPQLWHQRAHLNPQSLWTTLKKLTTNAFPLIPIGLGAVLIWLSLRRSTPHSSSQIEVDDTFWHTPLEETPLYQAWEKGFTWELGDEELRSTNLQKKH